MASLEYAERAKLFSKNLLSFFRRDKLTKPLFWALGNSALTKVEKKNGGYEASVATIKPGATNKGTIKAIDFTQPFPKTGSAIVIETMELNKSETFRDELAVDQLKNESVIANVVSEFGTARLEQFAQGKEEAFVSNFICADIDNFITGAETTVNGSVNAGATTLTLTSAADVTLGDIIFLGAITANGARQTVSVLVKSISGNDVTIETDLSALKGGLNGTRDQFDKVSAVLPALLDGAKVVIDKPIVATAENIYDYVGELETLVSEQEVPEGGFYIAMQPRVQKLFSKKDSVFVKFSEFLKNLGIAVFKKGKVFEFEDSMILANTNAMVRTVGGKKRYYVSLFKANYSVNTIPWMTSIDHDKITGTGGMGWDMSGVEMYDTHTFEEGAKSIATLVIEL